MPVLTCEAVRRCAPRLEFSTLSGASTNAMAFYSSRTSARTRRTPGRFPRAGRTGSSSSEGEGPRDSQRAEMLRRRGYQGSLVMLSADTAAPVDRPNLSKDYLAGSAPEAWHAVAVGKIL